MQPAVLRESHIVSKFFWKGSGLFRTQKAFNIEAINDPSVKIRNLQDGFKEYLLCETCEKQRSKWESYCAPLFFMPSSPARNPPCEKYFQLGNIDYTALKLLVMSTLWMMAVSSDPYYAHVKLNERRLRQLRNMILKENPGEPAEYGCAFAVLVAKPSFKPLTTLFSQPLLITRKLGPKVLKTYAFIIAGIHWEVFISPKLTGTIMEKLFLGKDGTLTVRVASASDFSYLRPLIAALGSG
jgi:hypothetical protein